MLQDPEAKARGLIFHQMWNDYTHFTWQSFTGESYRHQGSVMRTLSDDISISASPPAQAQREDQHRHYTASARSAGDCCVRRWLTISRKQRVCDICSKSILKPFSDIFFFIVIYKNRFSQQNSWENSTCCYFFETFSFPIYSDNLSGLDRWLSCEVKGGTTCQMNLKHSVTVYAPWT